jgi:hypothetical protein
MLSPLFLIGDDKDFSGSHFPLVFYKATWNVLQLEVLADLGGKRTRAMRF